MLFGSRERVAVELELDPDPGGVWLFGKVCLWACGKRIGDYERGTSLRDVLFRWERISRDAGHRENAELFSLEAKKLVRTLNDGMYGCAGDDATVAGAIEEQWATHEIRPQVDVFDEWRVFLVERNPAARLVYHDPDTDTYGECLLEYGEFDRVLKPVVQTLAQWYIAAGGTA